MNRTEFMEKLRILLSDIEENEREEALEFYDHYFEDAGLENEQQVIRDLGSPEKVAKTIKDGLGDTAGEQGEFTENGYSGYGEAEKKEVGYPEKPSKRAGNGKLILLLILAVFALPVLGPVFMGVAGGIFGIIVAATALLFALIIAGIGLLVAGAGVFAAAIAKVFVAPAVGIILFGVALLLLGVGILVIILGIWVVSKAVPAIIRFIVKIVSKIFKKKEE